MNLVECLCVSFCMVKVPPFSCPHAKRRTRAFQRPCARTIEAWRQSLPSSLCHILFLKSIFRKSGSDGDSWHILEGSGCLNQTGNRSFPFTCEFVGVDGDCIPVYRWHQALAPLCGHSSCARSRAHDAHSHSRPHKSGSDYPYAQLQCRTIQVEVTRFACDQ